MLSPQFILPIAHELVVDLFAGGGGASTGIEQAIGRHVDIAINHDPEAVSLHEANHPQTRHFVSDVFEVNPLAVTAGQPVGLLWASPDCKHFSKAKGGKPVSKKIRSLAWVVVKWAKLVGPRVICLENVEEFQTWGPLTKDGMPCPERKGQTFKLWVAQLRGLGYVVEWRELRACDFGAPTIRKRLFLVARRDGMPIVWPEATHGAPDSLPVKQRKLKAWRTAAECIDWTAPAPSIFERTRPLAEATCRRIAKGVQRYVIEADEPFIVSQPAGKAANQKDATNDNSTRQDVHRQNHEVQRSRDGARSLHQRLQPGASGAASGCGGEVAREPMVRRAAPGGTGRSNDRSRQQQNSGPGPHGTEALTVPTLIKTGYGERPGQAPRVPGLDKPLGTVVAGQKHALVSAFLAKHYTGAVGSALPDPMATVTSVDHHSLVAAHLVTIDNQSSTGGHSPATTPLKTTVTENRHALVNTFLIKYYGTDQDPNLREPLHTVTTKDRFGLVTVKGEAYAIVDIGLRMLTPRELYRAQGFPESYAIDTGADGRPLTKTAQVRMCGNSVCPPLARALVAANYAEQQAMKAAA